MGELDAFFTYQEFCVKLAVPACHKIGPLSLMSPVSEEQPGPPLNLQT